MEVDEENMTVEQLVNQHRNEDALCAQIVEYTKAMTPIADMAILCNISESELRELLRSDTHFIAVQYRKTKAKVGLELRRQVLERAAAGAPTAIEEVKNLYSAFNKDNP